MIIWINGAFGAGKTQTAYELHRRTTQSYVYDPENAGYFIRKNVPVSIREKDFQDYPMWRECNYQMLKHLDETYEGIVIAPMTIVNPQYFDEIIGRLRDDGVTVHHFSLCATEETLKKRLRGRGEKSHSWAEQQIKRCVTALSDDKFHTHLDTNRTTVSDNAERIASMSNIVLSQDSRGPIKKAYDRVLTQVKHIRF
ncbi:AAA family ATPase [Paenibacillus sp. FSL H8-0548]|uniref:AAA family ATPase n=1 Tax=Paenibacillus sp. FSL H8-0548 TaxID=1920422 RepID=UPI0015C368FC|nr:AAA family ATPase [Paenibacillus sp. FSL H8-0548]